MANSYQKFLSIIAKWPVCTQKKTRDYGFHLRSLVKQSSDANFFPANPADVEKILNCLTRLEQDKYKNKYKCSFKKGASGLEAKDIAVVLTDEFIEYFNSNLGFTKYFFK